MASCASDTSYDLQAGQFSVIVFEPLKQTYFKISYK